MSTRTQMFGILIALFMLLLVLELVRRRRLRVGYSLAWLMIGAGALGLIALPPVLNVLARLLGVADPRSLLFAAGIAFSFWILLDHSLTLTKLWRQDKEMAQQFALLEWQVRQLRTQLDELAEAHLELLDAREQHGQRPERPTRERQVGYALSYQAEDGLNERQV